MRNAIATVMLFAIVGLNCPAWVALPTTKQDSADNHSSPLSADLFQTGLSRITGQHAGVKPFCGGTLLLRISPTIYWPSVAHTDSLQQPTEFPTLLSQHVLLRI